MNCKNCNTELQPKDDYCSSCGGRVIRNRLTIRNLFEHISETFFNYDNKLLRTFINLFRKPEDVIVGYINGTRKKYVNVISYFALAITLSGIQVYVIQKFQSDLTLYDTSTEVGKTQQEVFENVFTVISEYQSLVMMLYIPIYALIARLVFLRINLFNYTELIVVFLYTQAQFSICMALVSAITIPAGIISLQALGMITSPFMFFYFAYTLKRVYKLDFAQIVLRSLIFLVIMIVLFVGISVLTGIYMYYSGAFDQMIEAKKAAMEAKEVIKDSIN